MNTGSNQPSSDENVRQYGGVFAAAPDGLVISDLETGIVVEANPAAWLMHGFTREEFIGLSLITIIHSDSQFAFHKGIQDFQSSGVFEMRTLHIHRDGSTFFGEWSGTAFTYQGRLCLLGMIRDVSKRIQAEQNLHQSVEARTREQATLLDISHTLASTLAQQKFVPFEFEFQVENVGFVNQTRFTVCVVLDFTQ